MFEGFIGVIFFLCISYYFYKTERNKRDEKYDVYNPTEFFDYSDEFMSCFLRADMLKMRLYYERQSSEYRVLSYCIEYLMKENEGGKILIKEILNTEENSGVSKE